MKKLLKCFRLFEILTDFEQTRLSTTGRIGSTGSNESTGSNQSGGKQVAQILPNGNICFAGSKLPIRVPSNEDNAETLREALNTFIILMAHRRGKDSSYFQSL